MQRYGLWVTVMTRYLSKAAIALVLGAAALCAFACVNSDDDYNDDPPTETAPSITTGWLVGETESGDGILLKTTDGGNSWKSQGGSLLSKRPLSSIVAVNASTAWAAGATSALVTTDGGVTWNAVSYGGVTSDIDGLYAPSADVVWAVGTNAVVLRSTDAGESWKSWVMKANPSTIKPSDIQVQAVYALDDQVAWVGGGLDTPVAEKNSYIWFTADGGNSWTTQFIGGYKSMLTIRGVPGCTPSTLSTCQLWGGGGGALTLITKNGGGLWTAQRPIEPQMRDVNGLAVVNASVAYAATDWGMVFTTTGGVPWNYVAPGTGVTVPAPPPNDNFYLGAAAISATEFYLVDSNGGMAHGKNCTGTGTTAKCDWLTPPDLPIEAGASLFGIDFAD